MIQTNQAPAGDSRSGFVVDGNDIRDVIIVGGGPAGLSAALVLARCRRSLLVFDTGKPRNGPSRGMHGYLTRDGIVPGDFLSLAREELSTCYGVNVVPAHVVSARRSDDTFLVTTADGQNYRSRRILVATGVVDIIPDIKGVEECFGKSVFHCPYCDGWEMRDQPLGVMGKGRNGVELSLALKDWSDDIVLLTNGIKRLRDDDARLLEERQVTLRTERVARVAAHDGYLERIEFVDGPSLERKALFISYGQVQHSDLVRQLGCEMTHKGVVRTDRRQYTNVPGVFVAGDAARDMHMVVVAAAEGAKAGITINKSFEREQLKGLS